MVEDVDRTIGRWRGWWTRGAVAGVSEGAGGVSGCSCGLPGQGREVRSGCVAFHDGCRDEQLAVHRCRACCCCWGSPHGSTGVGSGLGAAMVIGTVSSGAFSAGAQYVTTGSVDPKQVALDGAIGGAAGVFGAGGATVAARMGGGSLVRTVAENGAVNLADSATHYSFVLGLHAVSGYHAALSQGGEAGWKHGPWGKGRAWPTAREG